MNAHSDGGRLAEMRYGQRADDEIIPTFPVEGRDATGHQRRAIVWCPGGAAVIRPGFTRGNSLNAITKRGRAGCRAGRAAPAARAPASRPRVVPPVAREGDLT